MLPRRQVQALLLDSRSAASATASCSSMPLATAQSTSSLVGRFLDNAVSRPGNVIWASIRPVTRIPR
jgi:hypothetical protein